MNVEKLFSLVSKLINENKNYNFTNLFNEFVQSFKNNSKDNMIFDERILKNFFNALEKSICNELSHSESYMLQKIKGEVPLGLELIDVVKSIITQNVQSPTKTFEKIGELFNKFEKFYDNINKTYHNFRTLNIDMDKLNEDEYEIGIIIPNKEKTGNIELLIDELKIFQFFFETLHELFALKTKSPCIRAVGSSDIEIFLLSDPHIAFIVSITIKGMINLHTNALNIQTATGSLRDHKISNNTLKIIEEEKNKQIDNGLDDISDEIMKDDSIANNFKTDDKEGRLKELRNKVKQSLKKILKRIEKGTKIEINQPPKIEHHLTKEDSENNKNSNNGSEKISNELIQNMKEINKFEKSDNVNLAITDSTTTNNNVNGNVNGNKVNDNGIHS